MSAGRSTSVRRSWSAAKTRSSDVKQTTLPHLPAAPRPPRAVGAGANNRDQAADQLVLPGNRLAGVVAFRPSPDVLVLDLGREDLCATWMIEQKQSDQAWEGCIVNISSMSASVASANRGEYCMSKAALSMATKLWATRLGEFGIPVYEVRPGIIRTDMTAAVAERYTALIKEGLTVERRWGAPDDVGRVVATLARGDLPYSTGQVITVDGGLTIQRL